MSMDLVKSELMTRINFDESCSEIWSVLPSPEREKLQKMAKSSDRYSKKHDYRKTEKPIVKVDLTSDKPQQKDIVVQKYILKQMSAVTSKIKDSKIKLIQESSKDILCDNVVKVALKEPNTNDNSNRKASSGNSVIIQNVINSETCKEVKVTSRYNGKPLRAIAPNPVKIEKPKPNTNFENIREKSLPVIKYVLNPKKDEPNVPSLVKIDRVPEVGGTVKIMSSANTIDTHVNPLRPEVKLAPPKKEDVDNSNIKIFLINPRNMDNKHLCANCKVNKREDTKMVTVSTNTENNVSDNCVQTDETFDILNYLLDDMKDVKKEKNFIIGTNVNMGSGPTICENNNERAKIQFFKDLQTCLTWDSGNLPIHKTVIEKDLAGVRRQCVVLKARHANINELNSNNYTPLQLAVIHNVDIEIVEVLLEYKADASILDCEGNNVLHLAVGNNRDDLLELFLNNIKSSKLNIDQFNYDGMTPLMCCAFHADRIDMAEKLLKKGAQPNLRDLKSGRTAIFHAAENHNTPMVSLLLDYSADTKMRNFFGTSVHDAMFELDDIPKEIKYPILGRDLKFHHKRRLNQQDARKEQEQIKRRKLHIVQTFQKILTNTKFVVNGKANK
ncbi:hypothetical protein HHI36_021611 [Cryptolaemus montrouzieri]|uniref:Uncharacterized protein n=1 Tax=Cryptolaemus montrouzieri TaxID=559131 RepID=A0ABD2MXF9_9CUCU